MFSSSSGPIVAKQSLTAELFYGGTWNAVAAYTRDPALINRDRPVGSEPTPSSVSVSLEGIHNPKNPMSPLYSVAGQNTPIRLKLGSDVRFYGEVASWSPQSAIKGASWTVIECTGVLRRIGQGTDPVRSALTRAIGLSATPPLAWWPLEDNERSTVAVSPLDGVESMRPITEVNYETSDGIPIQPGGAPKFAEGIATPGVGKVASLINGGTLLGIIPEASTTDEWSMEFVVRFDVDTDLSTEDLALVLADGTYGAFTINAFVGAPGFDSGVRVLHGFDRDSGNEGDARAVFDPRDGAPHHIRYTVSQDGADYLARIYLDGNLADTADNFGSAMTGTVGQPREIEVNPISESGNTMPGAIGQFVFWQSETVPVDTVAAAFGYSGEQAHERFERLCDEEGIPVTIEGSESQPMGPQPIETLAKLFAEIEGTDDGLIFEPRDDYGLVYRTGRERYNRAVVLALDYAAEEVAPPLIPVLDDLSIRNDVTVQHRNGASVQAVLETGALSVLAPPDGVGRYKTQVDVNTFTVDVLANHAGWHLHKGTVDGIRYATVTVILDAVPALATDAAAVDIGDIITIDNLPEEETLTQVRLSVTGYTELIESHKRVITYSCILAETFDVGVYGTDAIVSRYDSAHSTLAASYDDNDTSFSVATAAGHALWVTGSSSPTFPFDWDIEGIRIRVTAISGASSPQTATVQRSVDGDDKALSSGSQVRLWEPARYGL